MASLRRSKHYAALFEEGRSWELRVLHNVEGAGEDEPARTTTEHEATCRVAKVRRWPAAVGSRITCDGALAHGSVVSKVPVAGSFLLGDWVASAKGLWRFGYPVLADAAPELDPAHMLIAAKPRPMNRKIQDAQGGERMRGRKPKNTWCATHSTWSGDESGDTYCFARNGGLRAGGRYFLGGSFDEVVFCAAPMLCKIVAH